MTPLEVLVAARSLIARPWGWGKGSYAQTRRGVDCYCSVGALSKASTDGSRHWTHTDFLAREEALGALARAVDGPDYIDAARTVIAWNDARSTRKRDVLAAFDKAIESLS